MTMSAAPDDLGKASGTPSENAVKPYYAVRDNSLVDEAATAYPKAG